ncbi:serpin B10 [Nephila pilipes]|uniref:Serpin B10 n=1 Tax=Nephila pilipes TaxID=299642 RepID=A0A8X6ML54_NEPPI|nr:serpin B10 [Nephila pilipes]
MAAHNGSTSSPYKELVDSSLVLQIRTTMEKLSTKNLLLTSICLLLFLSNASCDDASTLQCNQQSPISKIILSMCSRLIKEIKGEDNYFFSPLSISSALAMIYTGAHGTTKNQMTNALQYKMFGDKCLDIKVSEEFKYLIMSLKNENDAYTLMIVNSVFIHLGYPVSSKYTFKLQDYFKTHIKYVDFVNEEIQSMNTINEWVANNTKGQIMKLLNEPLDPMTIMILMNIIYFKGLWEHPFQEDATWNSFFYKKNGTSKIVPFMVLQDTLGYYYDKQTNYSYLELNYVGGNISMLLILPKDVRDFPEIDLTSEALCNIRCQLNLTNVMVVLPKFKLEYRRELSEDMMKLGMDELFSDRADLTGIREQNDIHVSLMIHKAVIEIDELGSEASAVSGVGIDARRKPAEQKIFWADHPFLFYIIDKKHDVILFAGRVADP